MSTMCDGVRVLMCVVGVVTCVLGWCRRTSTDGLVCGDQTPPNPKLQCAPAVNIEQAQAAGQSPTRASDTARRDDGSGASAWQGSGARRQVRRRRGAAVAAPAPLLPSRGVLWIRPVWLTLF
ncbi:hypothetical protein ACP4OV_007363 [Aristida adscensionis]